MTAFIRISKGKVLVQNVHTDEPATLDDLEKLADAFNTILDDHKTKVKDAISATNRLITANDDLYKTMFERVSLKEKCRQGG